MTEGTKPCPICGEEIRSVAKKCIHCGEFIELPAETERKTPCPKCRELISSHATKCIHCGEFISTRVGCSGWLRASWAEITGDKTLWDFVSLLIVPIMLAVFGLMLNSFETRRQTAIEDRRATAEAEVQYRQATAEAEIEEDRAEEAVLQAYLDRMSELLLKEGLRTAAEDAEVRKIALARTVTVLRVLDTPRQGIITQFLRQAAITQTLVQADLSKASLLNLDLCRLSLRGSSLHEANLSGAGLWEADLSGAYLSEADLSGAWLSRADLSGARLWEADLRGADLREADLREADLWEADLSGADLSWANLRDAIYNSRTTWPAGFDPVAAGAQYVTP